MADNVKIVSTEILADNFFPLKKVKYSVEKNGESTEVVREVYMTTNGVTILLYNSKNETVVLTKQFRIPTLLNCNESGMLLETCAGLVEDNENPDVAILREVEEETGYRIKEAKRVFQMYSTPGSVAEMLYYYVGEYTPRQKVSEGGGLEEENEDIEVLELPFSQAYNMIETGEIKDAKTALLLQYAKINLFGGEKVFEVL
jgi:nudix-type nucleoside diphosphatase (YffH/AdpP family)